MGGAGRATPGLQTRPGIGGRGGGEAGSRRGRDRARGAEPAQRPPRGEGLSRAESGGSGWARAEQGRVSLGEWQESHLGLWELGHGLAHSLVRVAKRDGKGGCPR